MPQINRRAFLATSSTALALLLNRGAHAESPFRMGAQSYSFRNFSMEEAIEQLKAIGLNEMEFFSGHIPVDTADPRFAAAKQAIAAAGIKVPCFGVESFGADEAENRKKFEFAKALGVEILTANPTADSFDNLERLTEEFDIKIAIHNHGPRARYDKVADTLAAVQGRSARIGACVDTGHVIRSGEKPHEVIEQLGDRVISLHLKDWELDGAEKIVGEGDLELEQTARALLALNFNGPIMLEYEEQPENPGPDMKVGLDNWNRAAAAAAS